MADSPKSVPTSVQHTVRREPGSRVTLEVEVAAERLARAADAAFARHVQQAKIPGFRPGKAPRAMYERVYGKEHLWEDAAEDLTEETYREIVDAEDIEPIDRPEVRIAQREEGKPLAAGRYAPYPEAGERPRLGPARRVLRRVVLSRRASQHQRRALEG